MFCICICAVTSLYYANAQINVPEPDFIGEVLVVKSNGESELLQKQISKVQTRASPITRQTNTTYVLVS